MPWTAHTHSQPALHFWASVPHRWMWSSSAPISTLLKHWGEEPSPFPQVWGLREKRKQMQPRVPEMEATVKCERAPGSGTIHKNTRRASSITSHLLPGARSRLWCGVWGWGIKKHQVHPQAVSLSTSRVWESALWFLNVFWELLLARLWTQFSFSYWMDSLGAKIMLTLGPDDQGVTPFDRPETTFSHFGYVSNSNTPILRLGGIFRGPTFPDLTYRMVAPSQIMNSVSNSALLSVSISEMSVKRTPQIILSYLPQQENMMF